MAETYDGMKVLGISQQEGVYEGRAFNNTYLHCVFNSDKVQGMAVTKVKMATSLFNTQPCKLGDVIDTNCDQYGRVKEIVFLQ